jgi:hypothetical protein
MGVVGNVCRLLGVIFVAYSAYDIRTHAIRVYGLVIHEVRACAHAPSDARARSTVRLSARVLTCPPRAAPICRGRLAV